MPRGRASLESIRNAPARKCQTRAKGLTLTFPPTSKEALISFILFDVSGITLFGQIVVLFILLD